MASCHASAHSAAIHRQHARGPRPQPAYDTGLFVPLAPLAVAPYLEDYGYEAADAASWRPGEAGRSSGSWATSWASKSSDTRRWPSRRGGRPVLELRVVGHEEMKGHTMYTVECSLALRSAFRLDWQASRRLAQLRKDLLGRVKHTLGDAYPKRFGQTPFASKGGLPGTTARLNAWFGALAACVNELATSPSVVGLALHFLDAPEPENLTDEDGAAGEEAAGEAARPAASKPPRVPYEYDEATRTTTRRQPRWRGGLEKGGVAMDFDLDLGVDDDSAAAVAPVARTPSRVEPNA